MNKSALIVAALLVSTATFAIEKTGSVKRDPAAESNCKAQVENAIKATAKALGLQDEIGIQLDPGADAGKDMMERPLRAYSSSAFIIDEGYVTGSGAMVLVRPVGKTCELVGIQVSIGK